MAENRIGAGQRRTDQQDSALGRIQRAEAEGRIKGRSAQTAQTAPSPRRTEPAATRDTTKAVR